MSLPRIHKQITSNAAFVIKLFGREKLNCLLGFNWKIIIIVTKMSSLTGHDAGRTGCSSHAVGNKL